MDHTSYFHSQAFTRPHKSHFLLGERWVAQAYGRENVGLSKRGNLLYLRVQGLERLATISVYYAITLVCLSLVLVLLFNSIQHTPTSKT